MSPKNRSETILCLGANGKVGTLLRRAWNAKPDWDWKLHPVSRREDGDATIWQPGDDTSALGHPRAILALWGVTSGNELATNTYLAHQALLLGEDLKAECVIHLSSAAVYGDNSAAKKENDPPSPVNPYGRAKLEMEHFIAQHQSEVPQVILRVGNVVGADSLFASLGKANEITLDRLADGSSPVRSYLCVKTLVDAVQAITANPGKVPNLINLAEAAPVEMADIVRQAGRPFNWQAATPNAIARVELDTSLLQTVMDLRPERATPNGILEDWRAWRGVKQ